MERSTIAWIRSKAPNWYTLSDFSIKLPTAQTYYSVRGPSDELNSTYIRTLIWIQSNKISLMLKDVYSWDITLCCLSNLPEFMLNQNLSQRKRQSQGQMEAFNQIPAKGLVRSALSVMSQCITAVLLMTNHTLRDVEGQNHFFPLTRVLEIRPQIKLVEIQSVFWSRSEKWTISPRDFFLCMFKLKQWFCSLSIL